MAQISFNVEALDKVLELTSKTMSYSDIFDENVNALVARSPGGIPSMADMTGVVNKVVKGWRLQVGNKVAELSADKIYEATVARMGVGMMDRARDVMMKEGIEIEGNKQAWFVVDNLTVDLGKPTTWDLGLNLGTNFERLFFGAGAFGEGSGAESKLPDLLLIGIKNEVDRMASSVEVKAYDRASGALGTFTANKKFMEGWERNINAKGDEIWKPIINDFIVRASVLIKMIDKAMNLLYATTKRSKEVTYNNRLRKLFYYVTVDLYVKLRAEELINNYTHESFFELFNQIKKSGFTVKADELKNLTPQELTRRQNLVTAKVEIVFTPSKVRSDIIDEGKIDLVFYESSRNLWENDSTRHKFFADMAEQEDAVGAININEERRRYRELMQGVVKPIQEI